METDANDLQSVLALLKERVEREHQTFTASVDAVIAAAQAAKDAYLHDAIAKLAAHNDLAEPEPETMPAAMQALQTAMNVLVGKSTISAVAANDTRSKMQLLAPEARAHCVRVGFEAGRQDPSQSSYQVHQTNAKGTPASLSLRLSEPSELPSVPLLEEVCKTRPLLLVGGVEKAEKLVRLRSRFAKVEWCSVEPRAHREAAPIAGRIRAGQIGAVIMLEELVSHAVSSPIADACRTSAVPLSYGAKAGTGALAAALKDIEEMLERQQLPLCSRA